MVESIESGLISASVGGHYMIGAWAMVMVYDHSLGAFPEGVNGTNPTFSLELMHAGNVEQISPLLEPQAWQSIDFRVYSLNHNPNRKAYDFRLLRTD